MRKRLAKRLAWSLWAIFITFYAVSMALEPALFEEIWAFILLYLGAFGMFATVGALIASHHPKNLLGWVMLVGTLLIVIGNSASGYATRAIQAGISLSTGAKAAAWLYTWLPNTGFLVILIFTFLLFPTGRLKSPRWRLVAGFIVAYIVVQLAMNALQPGPMVSHPQISNPFGIQLLAGVIEFLSPIMEVLLFPVFLAAFLSMVLRYKGANAVERQQFKWFALSALLGGILFGLVAIALLFGWQNETFFNLVWVSFVLSVPATIGIAILRYRLFDIDLLIRRTLVYTVLTVSLALVYAGSVVILQQVFRSLTGSANQSQLAIVVSTLAVAALFNPLRKRVQERIDHRFYRKKYDAERILATFADTARQETDLDSLTGQLIEAVQASLQPETASIWIKEMSKERPQ